MTKKFGATETKRIDEKESHFNLFFITVHTTAQDFWLLYVTSVERSDVLLNFQIDQKLRWNSIRFY